MTREEYVQMRNSGRIDMAILYQYATSMGLDMAEDEFSHLFPLYIQQKGRNDIVQDCIAKYDREYTLVSVIKDGVLICYK